MGSKTRIVILQAKKILYTILFILIAAILISLFIYMFFIQDNSSISDSSTMPTYTPGVYTTSIHLGETPVNLKISVDANHVNSITTSPLEESVTAVYPLLESCLENIEAQITSGVSPENVVYDESSRYTASVLLDAISIALNKASN